MKAYCFRIADGTVADIALDEALAPCAGLVWVHLPQIDDETTAWLQELTGVEIEWLVVPSHGAIEQMNLQLASGDVPDAARTCCAPATVSPVLS